MDRCYSIGLRLFAYLAIAFLVLGTLAAPGPYVFGDDPGDGGVGIVVKSSCPDPSSDPCPTYPNPGCSNGLCVVNTGGGWVCDCVPNGSNCKCPP